MLTRDELRLKASLDQKYAELIYDGLWPSPLRRALDAFNAALARAHDRPRASAPAPRRGRRRRLGARRSRSTTRSSRPTAHGDRFKHDAAVGLHRALGASARTWRARRARRLRRLPATVTVPAELQWGGRFTGAPGCRFACVRLLARRGSRPRAVRRARLARARRGAARRRIIDAARATALRRARCKRSPPRSRTARSWRSRGPAVRRTSTARSTRACANSHPGQVPMLHAGRSRNDQVATTLPLRARPRRAGGRALRRDRARRRWIARKMHSRAKRRSPRRRTCSPRSRFCSRSGSRPWPKASRARRAGSSRVAADARESSPLGSGACSGSTLPLDRAAAPLSLGFAAPSRNALDAIGDRDVALDLLARDRARDARRLARRAKNSSSGRRRRSATCASATRPRPARASCRKSAIPIRSSSCAARRRSSIGELARRAQFARRPRALVPPRPPGDQGRNDSGQRARLGSARRVRARLRLRRVERRRDARASRRRLHRRDRFADALIARGVPARKAHALVGEAVPAAEHAGASARAERSRSAGARRALDSPLSAPLEPLASVRAKQTSGSTRPDAVATAIRELRQVLEQQFGKVAP